MLEKFLQVEIFSIHLNGDVMSASIWISASTIQKNGTVRKYISEYTGGIAGGTFLGALPTFPEWLGDSRKKGSPLGPTEELVSLLGAVHLRRSEAVPAPFAAGAGCNATLSSGCNGRDQS